MIEQFRRVYGSDKKLQELIFEGDVILNFGTRVDFKSPHAVKINIERGFWAIHDDFFDIHILEDTFKECVWVYEQYLAALWSDYVKYIGFEGFKSEKELSAKEQDLRTKLLSKIKAPSSSLKEFYETPIDLGYETDASKIDEEL